MGKIALLVSREEMIYQAHNILQEKKYAVKEMRVVQTKDIIVEARNSIAGGASIIIARGLQASLIKQYTDIPVVEIVLTAQEMALLVMKAKQIVKNPRPVIAVVGFENMFCDMSYFDAIYDIELRTYFAPSGAELKNTSEEAVRDQVDLIIGGDTAVEVATKAEIPSLFLSITEDSLRNAFSMAESMDYAMGVEKKNAAQMETLLDYSFNGVIRLDQQGIITSINPFMMDMLEEHGQQMVGKSILACFPEIGEGNIKDVLEKGKEYSLFMQIEGISVFAMLVPVLIESQVDGAILTCHKMKKKPRADQRYKDKSDFGSMIALAQFEDMVQVSPAMQACIRLAKLYALSEQPLVIMGEAGTEKNLLAQSIHNSSLHSAGAFYEVSCDGLSGGEQWERIFGEQGIVTQINGGSLLIQDIEQLTAANQYHLYRLIRYKICEGVRVAQTKKLDIRIMVTSERELSECMESGYLRKDLYYLLSGLVVRIPPLRERKEDLQKIINDCMKECCERYSRYHVLTRGAQKILMEYLWPGNLLQVESFCERLILTAGKRSVDEIAVRQLLEEMYLPAGHEQRNEEFPECEEARIIREALHKYGGKREKTANALGISKATLWRHMKKYNIQ